MKAYKILIPVLLLLLWSALSYFGIVSEFFLATPSDTFLSLYKLIISGQLIRDIVATLLRVVIGLSLGTLIGMAFGLIIGTIPSLWKYFEGTADFFRSLPAFALFPFFVLIFGPGDSAKIATVTWFISFIMLISTVYAVHDSNLARIKSAKALGASRLQCFLFVMLPGGLPQFSMGFRTCLAFAPIVVIATEMFSGTQYGLGDRIYEARLLYKVADMYGVLLVTGLMGYGMNRLFIIVCNKYLHWSGR